MNFFRETKKTNYNKVVFKCGAMRGGFADFHGTQDH